MNDLKMDFKVEISNLFVFQYCICTRIIKTFTYLQYYFTLTRKYSLAVCEKNSNGRNVAKMDVPAVIEPNYFDINTRMRSAHLRMQKSGPMYALRKLFSGDKNEATNILFESPLKMIDKWPNGGLL